MQSWIPGVEPVLAFKIVSTLAIFFLGLISALLPLKLKASPRVLSALNVMGGGVFLSTGLNHLLADSAEGFEGKYDDFPMGFCMCGIGFMVTLMIEQIAHEFSHKKQKKHNASSNSTVGINSDSTNLSSLSIDTNAIDFPAEVESELSVASFAILRAHYVTFMRDLTQKVQSLKASYAGEEDANSSPLLIHDPYAFEDHAHSHDAHAHAHGEEEDHGHSHGIPSSEGGLFTVLALWVALSFHSIMEGLALGASTDENYSIFIAIMAHKGLESFALGTSIVRSNSSKLKYFLLCCTFAAMSPFGILVGIALDSFSDDSIVSSYVTAFAAGTFLYVAVVEVIINELKPVHDKFIKLFLLAVGYTLMAVLAIWT